MGDKSHNPLPPLPVQGVGSITITIVQPGSLQAANTSTSLPEGTEIYALAEGQAPRKLWSGKDEIVYALAARPDGLLALSGNRGHIFRIQPTTAAYADVAHLDAQQGLSLADAGCEARSRVLIGTGNTGKLVMLGAAEKHEYASDVLDAGALARFGRIEVEPGSTGYELLTRSGNVEQPVRGWSDWQPLKDGSVASPAGRFLQWKAVLRRRGNAGQRGRELSAGERCAGGRRSGGGARRAPQSAEPAGQSTADGQHCVSLIRARAPSITFDAGRRASRCTAMKDRTAITVRWAAHDDNGDDLIYSLYLRGDGETVWRLLKDKITDKAYSFRRDADSRWRLPDQGRGLRRAFAHARRRAHRRQGERPIRSGHHAAGGQRSEPQLKSLPHARKRLVRGSCMRPSTPKMPFRRSRTPNTRSTRARGSSSSRSASSPIRSTSTTNSTSPPRPSTARRRAPDHRARLRPVRQRGRGQDGDSARGKVDPDAI